MIELAQSGLEFLGFALNDCTVEVDPSAAKYLRVVHRTALELAVQNRFGADVGGYWLLTEHLEQLRKLPSYYSTEEAIVVRNVIESYITAQMEGSNLLLNSSESTDYFTTIADDI